MRTRLRLLCHTNGRDGSHHPKSESSVKRRDLFQAGAALAVTAALPTQAQATPNTRRPGQIFTSHGVCRTQQGNSLWTYRLILSRPETANGPAEQVQLRQRFDEEGWDELHRLNALYPAGGQIFVTGALWEHIQRDPGGCIRPDPKIAPPVLLEG